VLNDINRDLINVYEVIKEDVDRLVKELKSLENNSDFYYSMRELDRSPKFKKKSKVKKAARLIYLNKTCYNGLFRVNSQ
jgi:DNA adenine methylase